MAPIRKIPALVVSGFLGSGKTTLIRRLLSAAQAEGARVAFISNELGELGIDQALLGGGQESFVELAGGCVCCQLNDELYETLLALREQVDPDRIVVETSGVAIPHDVQITFYQPPIRDWISEEAVVTVVDAEQLRDGRDLEGTFEEQVESADLVLLHKIDLVDRSSLDELEGLVDGMNPGVPVVYGSHGDLDPRILLADGLGQFDEARSEACDHDHDHQAFTAFEERVPAGLTEEQVRSLLQRHAALRIKGFVELDQGPAVVQGVGRRMEIVVGEAPANRDLLGRVVVIRRA